MAINKFKFNKKKIEEIEIPDQKEARVRYYDSVTRGLCLRVTGNGAKSYTFYRKVKGKVFSEKLGDFPDMTVEQARGKADELNSRISKGENVWEFAEMAKSELTLEQMFAIYMERHAEKTRKTAGAMRKDFDRLAKPIRFKKLSEITFGQAEHFHRVVGENRGKYAANRAVQLLKAVYNRGIAWKIYSGDNPFKGITLFEEKPRQRFLSKQEAGRLLNALNEKAGIDLRHFISLCLFTGVRKSNIFSMKWEDIDFEHETWTIPDTKNGTSQKIALGVNELQILKSRKRRAGDVFVFNGTGKTGHITDMKRAWTTLRAKAGISNCTIHDLRRSLGAAMASANINIALVKSALNHKDIKTTMAVYALTHKEAERAARELVQKEWLDFANDNTVLKKKGP